jgi:hypothetical protein
VEHATRRILGQARRRQARLLGLATRIREAETAGRVRSVTFGALSSLRPQSACHFETNMAALRDAAGERSVNEVAKEIVIEYFTSSAQPVVIPKDSRKGRIVQGWPQDPEEKVWEGQTFGSEG